MALRGIIFDPDTPPEVIAQKMNELRANALAAKGQAQPSAETPPEEIPPENNQQPKQSRF